MLDRTKLRAAIRHDTERIRGLKERQREPRRPRWQNGLDDWQLIKLKREATVHHAIAAHARGKVHLTHYRRDEQGAWVAMALDEQAKMIEKERAKFEVPEAVATAGTP